MINQRLEDAFRDLSAPLVTDACVRARMALRLAPPGLAALVPGSRIAGRALPVRHYGQFKTFLARRAKDPGYTFRTHLRALGGAIEE